MLLWGIWTLNLSNDIIAYYQQQKSTPAIMTPAAACHCNLNFLPVRQIWECYNTTTTINIYSTMMASTLLLHIL